MNGVDRVAGGVKRHRGKGKQMGNAPLRKVEVRRAVASHVTRWRGCRGPQSSVRARKTSAEVGDVIRGPG